MKKRILIGALVGVVVIGGFGTHFLREKGAEKAVSADAKTVTLEVAYAQDHAPYDFVNADGQADGFEVAVLKAVDDRLDHYDFHYTGTSDEDLLVGLESGKYDIGTKAAWYTKERAEQFIIPSEPIGASVLGLAIRQSDSDRYTDIDQFAQAGGRLVPISPQNAQYAVVTDYNQTASTPLNLTEADNFTATDAYGWLLEGRYDGYFVIKTSFDNAVTQDSGAYHDKADQLAWIAYKGILTYPILHRSDRNEAFSKVYDKAITALCEDGTLSKLSQDYFGEDVFTYVTD